MLLYLDTSCMAKLFIEEPDALRVRNAVAQATGLATSVVSYVEMKSLVARRSREKLLKPAEAKRILDVFESDWAHYAKVPVEDPLLHRAARLVARYPLRTLDALHLASALSLMSAGKGALWFLTADQRLRDAAGREKMKVDFS